MATTITNTTAPNNDNNSTPTPNPAPSQPIGSTEPASKQYASIIPSEPRLTLEPTHSNISHHDMPHVDYIVTGDDDIIYTRFSERRKNIITAVLSFCAFLAPVSSTTVLSAVPEVAATFGCDGAVINGSNALYMLFMGLSPCFYGPVGNIYGRKWISVVSAALFFAFSIGTALAPNLASFFVFRILTAIQGTAFLVIGSSVIGDIYKPTERGTALGWFLSGTLIGPALGPFIGGIIVTFRTWRDLFWLQTALAGVATVLVLFLLPETIHSKRSDELEGLPKGEKARKMWQWLNPLRVIQLYRYPNLLTVALASSSLVWNMYSLLTPIRYVLNPRFGLTSPLQSGLFFMAPGCGYVLGTFVGGRWADHIVKKYIRIRGERIAEDRLRSCLVFMGAVIPACMIIYGWSVEKRKGGIALPVIMMFLQGVAQLFCFPSLNVYCLDVMQTRSSEVVAGNYMVRYLFAAAGSAACLPAIRKMGVGWFSTISAFFLIIATFATYLTALYGKQWRDAIDEKKARKKECANQFIARSEYDRGINTFSPEGRLFQVEYSLEAIKHGSTAIGVATGEGVILGVEKRVTSTLLETSSVEKIVEIDSHIGCAMSGLQADARSMVEHARVESQNHAFNYNERLRVESCTQAICDLALRFGEGAEGEESIMSRPFGVALLIAGYDEDGPSLYHAEPSGTFYRYDAKAIGSGSEGAQAELQNEFHKSLTLPEAEVLVLKTLKQVMEEKLDSKNVQLASVTKANGFKIYTDAEMEQVVGRLPTN
ncbi:nucleophile aminohydrolase [Dendryphion nanum]|uniref:Nucleophile aminohydrolase n=1 Tax=Dendryphion nanum TaxID=256645 RepID=A0A9P9D411_9PLEO|nr:nucleophile aminohydrolase [Dendryphion nanum]